MIIMTRDFQFGQTNRTLLTLLSHKVCLRQHPATEFSDDDTVLNLMYDAHDNFATYYENPLICCLTPIIDYLSGFSINTLPDMQANS